MNLVNRCLFVAALFGGAAALAAEDEQFPAAMIAGQATELLQKAAKDPSGAAGATFGTYGNHKIQYNARTKSGAAEIHGHWVDVFYITGGEASLMLGGTVPDAKAGDDAEQRGTTIVGGHERKLAKGDVVHIPANTPHQFLLAPGQSITFLVVKVQQP